jgi:hypothetical protein
MNRLKLWLFVLVVVVAGLVNVVMVTREGAAMALRDADASLEQGAAAHRALERIGNLRASTVATLAARDEALLASLAPEPAGDGKKKPKAPEVESPADLEARHEAEMAAAGIAVKRATDLLGLELPAGAFWLVGRVAWLDAHAADKAQADAVTFLRDAATGKPRAGYARIADAVWYGVSKPAGPGAGLAVFFPVDAAWVSTLKQESGCDVTVAGGGPQPVTTLPLDQARAIATSVATPGQATGQGQLGRIQLTTPFRILVPLLFSHPPATRSIALGLAGLPRGYAVLSVPTAKAFTSLAHYQWISLEMLAGLAVIGFLLSLLLRTEVLPQVPAELVAAATRIERGDFTVRAPTFAGALGTISGALNRASEAVQAARSAALKSELGPALSLPPAEGSAPRFDFTSRPATTPREPLRVPDIFDPGAPGAQRDVDPFAVPPGQGPPSAPAPGSILFPTAALASGAAPAAAAEPLAAAPVVPPAAAPVVPPPPADLPPAPRQSPAPTSVGLTQVVIPTVAAPSGTSGAEEDEEVHWRAVHAEFLDTRVRCGESIENLGFERFRPKLQKNKEALLQKYGCRAVRFSVYVKEGKAALKATPVR